MAPTHVARSMIVYPDKTIAEDFSVVSVLFITIHNFESMAEKMEGNAKDLLSFLNNHFEAWDNICRKYDITKIETWKEDYICAVGVVPERRDGKLPPNIEEIDKSQDGMGPKDSF